jgi:hypothetical protein
MMKLNILAVFLILGFVCLMPLWAADEATPAGGGDEGTAKGGGDEEVVTSVGSQGEIIFEGMVITGKKLSPEFYISAPINPTFPTVTFSRSFKDDILTPIDTSEFKEHVSRVRMARVKNPILWVSTATCITTGVLTGYMAARGENNWIIFAPICAISGGWTLYEYLTQKPEEKFE